MHLTNLASIAAVFILTFCFVSSDDILEVYKELRERARSCMPGRAIEVSNKCHLCICVIVGVIKCDPIKCPIGGLEDAEDENDDNVDSPESEVAVQEGEVEEDDPEPEPTQDSDEPNDSSESVFQKLRDIATNCTPGKTVYSGVCEGCVCVAEGVMRCKGAGCLPPTKDDE